ncbi:SPOSA6832_02636, partial [Sporobolomyces salmonicolor]
MLAGPSFHTSRLVYRAANPGADDAFWLDLFSDPQVLFGTLGSVPLPFGQTSVDRLNKYLGEAALSVIACLPAEDANEGEVKPGVPVGWFCLNKMRDPHRKTSFGLAIHAKHQGKGYGKEAMEWLLEMAFLRFGLNKVEVRSLFRALFRDRRPFLTFGVNPQGEVFSWNVPAQKVYQSLGFVEEGRKRQSLFQEGEFRDELMYGLLASEWRERNANKLKP